MKTILNLIIILCILYSLESCNDSLGIDDNVQKSIKNITPVEDDESGFLPSLKIGDNIIHKSFPVDENGKIVWGGTVATGWFETIDSTVWCNEKCLYSTACDHSPWCYLYAYGKDKRSYTSPDFQINVLAWVPDKYNMTFPPVNNVWILRLDLNKDVKSWIALDSFQIDNYNMGNNFFFTGKRYIWSERGKDTTLFIAQKKMKCIKVIEHIIFEGEIDRTRMATDTSIRYTYEGHHYYGENNFGFVRYILKFPGYNFGLGDVPKLNWQCDVTGKKL